MQLSEKWINNQTPRENCCETVARRFAGYESVSFTCSRSVHPIQPSAVMNLLFRCSASPAGDLWRVTSAINDGHAFTISVITRDCSYCTLSQCPINFRTMHHFWYNVMITCGEILTVSKFLRFLRITLLNYIETERVKSKTCYHYIYQNLVQAHKIYRDADNRASQVMDRTS